VPLPPKLPVTLRVSDDSGFLALVDPAAYEGFVGEDWTLEDLVRRFEREMQQRRLLLWGTGAENDWEVQVRQGALGPPGFRSVVGPLVVTEGRILVTSYDSLTMAAQFADVHLPEAHEVQQELQVESGAYDCAIVQTGEPHGNLEDVAFTVVLNRTDSPVESWKQIPWKDEPGFTSTIS
jgi:hypothetical protein